MSQPGTTCEEDLGLKKNRYARLGVEEYFLHDPFAEYLAPALQGFRLMGGRYRAIAPAADSSQARRLPPPGRQLRLALRLPGLAYCGALQVTFPAAS